MASPHVAGTVALMWSRAPVLVGDIAITRTLLDDTAVDTPNAQCGGTDDDNNVFGEGRLDALAAVSASPAQAGTLTGTVTNAANGNPIAGATIHAVGPADRTTTTDAAGQYSFVIAIGTYDVTASEFGFVTQTASGVVVTEGATTTQNFALAQVPTHQVSGHVRDSDGNPLANGTVEILDTPIPPATTDASGFYSFASVPEGTYDLRAEAGRCNDPQEQNLVVDGDETLDFTLPLRTDSFGYTCVIQAPAYIEANTVLPGRRRRLRPGELAVHVRVVRAVVQHGVRDDERPSQLPGAEYVLQHAAIPTATAPNAAIYPFWDDLIVDGSASVRTELLGAAPTRRFVIEWRNATFFGNSTLRVDFEVVLHEDGGAILTQYRNIANDGREMGNSATLGIENRRGRSRSSTRSTKP